MVASIFSFSVLSCRLHLELCYGGAGMSNAGDGGEVEIFAKIKNIEGKKETGDVIKEKSRLIDAKIFETRRD